MTNLPTTKLQEIMGILSQPSRRAAMAALLPKYLTPERMLRLAQLAFTRNPALLECTPASIVTALMEASRLGLEPDGITGKAYIIPYKRQATLIPGYRGLAQLACEDSNIEYIEAVVVYRHDKFTIRRGTEPAIIHEPSLSGERRDDQIIGAYALAKYRSGLCQFEFMTREEIDRVRSRSRAAESGPWVTDYAEMAKKTVVRRLCKYLNAKSPKLERALAIEAAAEEGRPIADAEDDALGLAAAQETATDRLRQKVAAQSQEPTEMKDPHDALADMASKLFKEYCDLKRAAGETPAPYAELMGAAGGDPGADWWGQSTDTLKKAINLLDSEWIPAAKKR